MLSYGKITKCVNGDCNKDIRTRIAMAKKRIIEIKNISSDRKIRKATKL